MRYQLPPDSNTFIQSSLLLVDSLDFGVVFCIYKYITHRGLGSRWWIGLALTRGILPTGIVNREVPRLFTPLIVSGPNGGVDNNANADNVWKAYLSRNGLSEFWGK